MQRIVAVLLVVLLVAPPAAAGQQPSAPVNWDKVQLLGAGAKITLTVTGQPPAKVRFLFADDATLVTLKPASPKLEDRVERTLINIGSRWPAVLREGEGVEDGLFQVSHDGVFYGGQKVADLADLVQQTPRGDVLDIPEVAPHSHSVRNILIGFAIAVVAAWLICLAQGYCGPD